MSSEVIALLNDIISAEVPQDIQAVINGKFLS